METKERDKTAEEVEIITLVNKATNELLEKQGLPPRDLSPEHIHLLPQEAYRTLFLSPESQKGSAVYHPVLQAILFSDVGSDRPLEFAQTLFHEMVHFKFWNTLQVVNASERMRIYRTGLAIVSRDGKQLHLQSLNEAITEDLTDEFYETVLKEHPLFAHEINEHGKPIRGYAEERAEFHTLLNKIAAQSTHTESDLRNLFVRAAATGNLLPIARIVDRTFGSGSFRRLGGGPDDASKEPGIAFS